MSNRIKDELDRALYDIRLVIARCDKLSAVVDTTSAKNLLIEAMRRLIIIEQGLEEEQ